MIAAIGAELVVVVQFDLVIRDVLLEYLEPFMRRAGTAVQQQQLSRRMLPYPACPDRERALRRLDLTLDDIAQAIARSSQDVPTGDLAGIYREPEWRMRRIVDRLEPPVPRIGGRRLVSTDRLGEITITVGVSGNKSPQ